MTSGIAYTAITALWAEVYGLQAPGGDPLPRPWPSRSSPRRWGRRSMGGLMDGGVAVETICLFFALYCLLASLLLGVATEGPGPAVAAGLVLALTGFSGHWIFGR